jgi:hypothetical protein
MNTKSFLASAVLLFTTGLFAAPAVDAAGRAKDRAVLPNAAGGVTAASGGALRGPRGGAFTRGRVTASDGAGSAESGGAAAVRTPAGGVATRAGLTTVGSDGSVQHDSGFVASGVRGEASSQGGFTRNPDGTVSGGRTTQATGANGGSGRSSSHFASGEGYVRQTDATGANGNSIDTDASITRDGRSVTRTCSNAAGEVVPCR